MGDKHSVADQWEGAGIGLNFLKLVGEHSYIELLVSCLSSSIIRYSMNSFAFPVTVLCVKGEKMTQSNKLNSIISGHNVVIDFWHTRKLLPLLYQAFPLDMKRCLYL